MAAQWLMGKPSNGGWRTWLRWLWKYGVPICGVVAERWSVVLEFKKEDAWVGVFVQEKRHDQMEYPPRYETWQHVWVCLLPCLPIHFKRRLR